MAIAFNAHIVQTPPLHHETPPSRLTVGNFSVNDHGEGQHLLPPRQSRGPPLMGPDGLGTLDKDVGPLPPSVRCAAGLQPDSKANFDASVTK